jgi:thioredoxin-like negative regulator of GroEL
VRRALAALVVSVAVAATAHAGGRISYGDYVRAVRAIDEQRLEEAEILVAELMKTAPDDADAQTLAAQLAFLDGDYEKARDLLDKIDIRKGLAAELKGLVASTLAATKGFDKKTSPGGHFVLFYSPGKDEVLVDLAAETLEGAYQKIGEDVGWRPARPVRVEILPRISDLARVSTLTEREIETSGTIALCKYNKLMVVSPRATIFGYPWLDTMAHELTHYLVSRATLDKTPIWLHEGLAKYEESRWRGSPGEGGLGRAHEHLLAVALRRGKLITFEQMHPSMALLPSQEAAGTAFAEVYTIVAWMREKIGYGGIRNVLAKIKEGKSERRAIGEVMGMPFESVESAWRRHLRTLNLRPDPAFAGRTPPAAKIRFDKSAHDRENVGVDQVPEVQARRFARLGGLLRARGHLAGAASEYEKARQVAPEDSFIGGKLARTYLELDQPEKAVEVATPFSHDKEDAGPLATLGAAYLKLGDNNQALGFLVAAERLSPFDPAVRCGLADAYTAIGDEPHADRERTACERVKRP